MAYFFLSDGGLNGDEHENNFLYFNGSDPHLITKIEQLFSSTKNRDSDFYKELEELCKSSFLPERNRFQFLSRINRFIKQFLRKGKQIGVGLQTQP